MKILYIDANYKHSSTGKIVYDLYSRAMQDGNEAAVCYGRGPLEKDKNVFKFGLDWETKLHALLTRVTGLTNCFSFFSTRRLIRFIKKFQPNLIHIHELHAYFINQKALFRFLKKKQIPIVYTMHCAFPYTGRCGIPYECERWKTGCGKCPQIHAYPKTMFFDFSAKMYRQKKRDMGGIERMILTAPSEFIVHAAKQSFLKERDIRVVRNGIDTENVFYPHDIQELRKKHGITTEKVVLAVAPNLMSEQKGGRWVLELAEMLKNEPIRFVLIGIDELENTYPDNVIALGRTANQQELAAYYSLADCFVICSKNENFPTTCLEALCCGTPVAGFDSGGAKETAPAPYGVFCQYGDTGALKTAVCALLNAGFMREEIRKAGESAYSKRNMYRAYFDLYQVLLSRNLKDHNSDLEGA